MVLLLHPCLSLYRYVFMGDIFTACREHTQRSRKQFPLGGKLCILFRDTQIIQCTSILLLVMGSSNNMHLGHVSDLPGSG